MAPPSFQRLGRNKGAEKTAYIYGLSVSKCSPHPTLGSPAGRHLIGWSPQAVTLSAGCGSRWQQRAGRMASALHADYRRHAAVWRSLVNDPNGLQVLAGVASRRRGGVRTGEYFFECPARVRVSSRFDGVVDQNQYSCALLSLRDSVILRKTNTSSLSEIPPWTSSDFRFATFCALTES